MNQHFERTQEEKEITKHFSKNNVNVDATVEGVRKAMSITEVFFT